MSPRKFSLVAALSIFVIFGAHASAQLTHQPPEYDYSGEVPVPIETPATNFDFVRREEMIPMRDGVKLFTVILIPKREGRMPILITRTPYNASLWSSRDASPRLASVLPSGDDVIAGAGYIRVYQDIRGRYKSEGDYVMNRPLRGPLNPTSVDHSTDTYDSIEWLLNNVPENNGRVGLIGTSYDGFLVLMGMVNPHPALKAAVPINPMVDTWMGDDWFHHGAFRQTMADFIYDHEPSNHSAINRLSGIYDNYDLYLRAGTAGELGRELGIGPGGFWSKLLQHPSYDAFWQDQAVDKILAGQPLSVPTLYVHSLWDQEDIYGAIASYMATEPKDRKNDRNFLVIGPWSHGGSNGTGTSLGPFKFNGDTALYFRREILLPFLNEFLKDDAPKTDIPPVLDYQTGTDEWQRYDSWPLSCEAGCAQKAQPLYLQAGLKVGFQKPDSDEPAYDEYVSDPAKPVPYRLRPIHPTFAPESTWGRWLVDDQRNFSDRPDVLSYESDVLNRPVKISGQPAANLYASTTGSDCDFVVKLIDVYPDEYPSQPELGGYQLMISADIMRGRYRKDWTHPEAIPAGSIERYRWMLPAATHVFLPGHRIMVQIQSSWFPLYDRNPQTYVENIFWAKVEDFRKATQRVYHSGMHASFIELPLVR